MITVSFAGTDIPEILQKLTNFVNFYTLPPSRTAGEKPASHKTEQNKACLQDENTFATGSIPVARTNSQVKPLLDAGFKENTEKKKVGRPVLSAEEKAANRAQRIAKVNARLMLQTTGQTPAVQTPKNHQKDENLSTKTATENVDVGSKPTALPVSKEAVAKALKQIFDRAEAEKPGSQAGVTKVTEILTGFGVKSLGALDPAKYPEILDVAVKTLQL